MNKLILTILAMMLAGCHGQARSGSICAGEFTTSGFRTSDPVEITQSVVNSVRDEIPYAFKKQIEAETWFTFEPDCKKADYIISGKVTMVNPATQGRAVTNIFGIVGSMHTRYFGVGLESIIRDGKTSKILSTYDSYVNPTLLEDTLYFLSRNITAGFKYEPHAPR